MLKYGAALELHAPPRVLEARIALFFTPASLPSPCLRVSSYREWILAVSPGTIEYHERRDGWNKE